MKNKNLIKKIISLTSIFIIIISFIIQKTYFLKPILLLIGIILISCLKSIDKERKISEFIKNFIIYLVISVIIDTSTIVFFNRIPIFSYNIIKTNNTIVYNSIGVRVWQCDKNNFRNLKVEPFYERGFTCDVENMEAVDSNYFFDSVIDNFSKYKNTFIKINGKISKKNGQSYIEMQPYEEDFKNDITLRIIFATNEEELELYDVYDKITIVGTIKHLEQKNNKNIVYMYDSKIVSETNTSKYKVILNTKNECDSETEIIYSNETKSLYSSCLDDITITFEDNLSYELSFALSSGKINLEDLYKDNINKKIYDNGSVIYEMNNYDIAVCNENKIIIGNENMDSNNNICK